MSKSDSSAIEREANGLILFFSLYLATVPIFWESEKTKPSTWGFHDSYTIFKIVLAKSLCKAYSNSCPKGTEKKEPNGGSLASRGRKGLAMATTRTKFQFTDYQMFAALMSVAGEVSPEVIKSAIGDNYDPEKHTPENLARKVSHKFHILKENAEKTKAPSKTAQLNKALAEKVAAEFADGKPFTLNDIMINHPNEVKTSSKAGVVVNVLLAEKRVRKAAPINNKTTYVIVA